MGARADGATGGSGDRESFALEKGDFMDGVIIGKRVRAIVGVDAVNGAECFGVIWDKPGSLLDIEGHGI